MKRRLTLLAALPALALGGVLAVPTAHADDFTYSGRLTGAIPGAPGIAGAQVVATAPLGGTAVVATTAADGSWSFTSTDDELWLYFDAPADFQDGWYDSCTLGDYLQPAANCTNGPGVIPDLATFATYAMGRILDTVSGLGVPNAVVEAYAADGVTLLGSDATDAAGAYRIDGLATDEIGLFVNGAPANHTSGFFGCVVVVPTFPEACTFAPGPQADRSIAPLLSAPRAVIGFSLARGSITLLFVRPATGTPTGYELTCTGPTGTTVVRNYSGPLQTRTGFARGRNVCTLRALSTAGPGPSTAPFTVYVF
ncbi:MAG: hypothetical protein Q7V88_13200 [Actinomycetota bacterium]|nr:hypothetical protein [Actinomycetota bacterium]